MKRRLLWRSATMTLVVAGLCACTALPRPTPPPGGSPVEHPWGSVPILSTPGSDSNSLSENLIEAMRVKFEKARSEHENGEIPYRALAISGGGSRGAYGAGILSGWTVSGDRPQFDVVTGISTGALMATHVFLGPDFDEDLKIYRHLTNDDVYEKRGLFAIFSAGSAFDTKPLRDTLLTVIDEDILDLVAAEHRAGRRLFVGSTNLDANLFTIWDLGSIAGSGRADRLQRYIDAIMASAAFPIAFQPIYIEVEGENGTYTQMHADGGIRETAFYFDFMEELNAAADAAGISENELKQEIYLLVNGKVAHSSTVVYDPVGNKLKDLASATVNSLMTRVTRGSVFRLWVRSMIDGSDFHVSFIPQDFELDSQTLQFVPEEEAALFDLGYRQSVEGTAWVTWYAPETAEEILKLILEPATRFDIQDSHRNLLKRDKPSQ